MANKKNKRTIIVYANWLAKEPPIRLGVLQSEKLRGKEIFSFQYDEKWVAGKFSQLLDPNLELYSGLHFLNDEHQNFGLFLDSSPDRWGRILMQRKEAEMARQEQRPEVKLFETDYLLGVFDPHRIGAIRFKQEENGPFLSNDSEMATPPWASLRELEAVSLKLEKDDSFDNPDYLTVPENVTSLEQSVQLTQSGLGGIAFCSLQLRENQQYE